MAEQVVTDPQHQSMTHLVKGIIEDGQALIRQEIELAKAEAHKQWSRAVKAVAFFATAVVFALFAVGLLTLAGVHLLQWLTQMPLWACYAIVGGVCVLITAGSAVWAYRKVKRIEVIPHQTAETMKENVRWLKNQT